MNDREVKETIFEILGKIAPDIDPIGLEMDDNIKEVFGIDSFDFLQFIIGLDDAFGIKTPEEDYGKISTLKALIGYLKSAK
ncbi:MAG: acyl carrier protein [Flavobacteriaceae bacterium]